MHICERFDQLTLLDLENKLDKDLFHGNTSFAGLTNEGVINKGSLTKRLIEQETEKGVKIALQSKF